MTTFDAKSLHEHVFSRINSTPLEREPFEYLYVRDIFPEDFYAELQASLPRDDRYETYPAPYEARRFIDVSREGVAHLSDFWQNMEKWINSQAFLDGMVSKFTDVLAAMSAHRSKLIRESSRDGRVRISPRTLLNRDYAHFALGPHTDATNKFVTAIFYLPRDNRFESFGTSIYRPLEDGFTSWRSPHYDFSQFRLIRTMQNAPNSLFVFAKSDKSFHGVEPGDYPNDGRDMLMWVPQIGAKEPSKALLELPIATFIQPTSTPANINTKNASEA